MLSRLPLAAAMIALTASPLAAFDINAMNDAERDAFRAEIRAYLMENPEVLLEAIDVLEQRQANEQAASDVTLVETNSDDIFNDGFSYVGGNPDGDITVVEFMDYRCGYCRRAHPDVNALVETDGNIRYVIKEFPILGDQSVLAAKFAIAVQQVEGEDAYFETHNDLMTMRGDVTPEALTAMANDKGFDTEAVMAAMESPEVAEVINANHALAQRMQISGTPTFVFETQLVRGYVPLDGMLGLVDELRGEG
ncbi:DsbA family protein [Pseudoruegeria sp. HB172150]|uniref:DsbA family protein n=1 Tax=Pseudoruegeria sp. HB172150 TaxID=2721164 RepID=UPI001557F17B|nr:DsbA family protein [Pseudoruegeria sp. HB172150]